MNHFSEFLYESLLSWVKSKKILIELCYHIINHVIQLSIILRNRKDGGVPLLSHSK